MEWKMAWSYLPINHNISIGTISNITQRTFIKNNINGTKIKVKFSNLYAKQSLVLEKVVIGKRNRTTDNRNTEIVGFQNVTCQGKEVIVVDAGKELYSDAIDFSISAAEDIVLSVYVKETADICSVCSTWAAGSWNTRYGCNGDFTREQNFAETDSYEVYPVLQYDIHRADNLFGISEIKVYTDHEVKTVALFGDSITHMSYYSDALMKRLYKAYHGKITVVNRGIGGNRLLRDYSRMPEIPSGGTIFGSAGVERFYHDIYGTDYPEYVLVLIGINDFTHPYALKHYDEAVTLEEYQKGMEALVQIAHENGSKIMLGTLMPFCYEETDWYSQTEKLRQKANEWIRKQEIADGVMDFDLALRKADDPEYMLSDCHLGDGLHPNAAGGEKMAEAVNLEWFKEEKV